MTKKEKPALLIIDMVKDNLNEENDFPITPLAKRIIKPINNMIRVFRERQWPIVFSTDAYYKEDFIFEGKMKPHSLAGTEGAEIIDELHRYKEDFWLPKPKFSAFFKTELDHWLKERGVTLCVVTGLATHFCVLTTVMDALCFDFKAVLLEDCTTAFSQEIHEHTLGLYRKNPLYPLLKVTNSAGFLEDISRK